MLPKDQIENIKQQLISQLQASNLPNAEEIKKSILQMNPEQLEEFLIQNKLIKEDGTQSPGAGGNSGQEGSPPNQCIFCSIVSGQMQSYKIDENKDSIAVLEINPISHGHSLVIPKEHISSSEKIPQTSFSLAKKIAKKIKTKFKPKDILISSSNLFGHEIINILPVYENETLGSERKQATKEELEKLQKLLEKKTKPKTARKPRRKEIKEKNHKIKLPKRIP